MNFIPILLALSLSNCPLIDKGAEITFPYSYFEMGEEDDLTVIREERKATAAYQSLHYGSVTVLQWENLQEHNPFKLILIPFNDERSSLLQQLQVLKSLLWGPFCPTPELLEEEQTTFKSRLGQEQKIATEGNGQDVFCKNEVIQRQTLWEGKTVRLLYPTSVLPEEPLAPHFLIVTKRCRPDFASLTDEEALEVESVSRKLFEIFKTKGFESGIKLQKNGTVGVTVPYFHQHIVLFKNKEEEQQALYQMIKNVFIGSSSLSTEQYKTNYDHYKTLLNPIL